MRSLNDFEVQGTVLICKQESERERKTDAIAGNSVERISQYVAIEQEPKPTNDNAPPAHWPSSGDLRVENMSARYSVVSVSYYLETGPSLIAQTGWPGRPEGYFVPYQVWRAHRYWYVTAICHHSSIC